MKDTIENIEKRKLYRAKEVAEILAIGVSTVYAYVDQKILIPVYLPRSRDSTATHKNRNFMRFKYEEIERFLKTLS